MKFKPEIIFFLIVLFAVDLLSQSVEIKTENLNQEEWEAARDYFAIELIKLLAKLDTLEREIDSLANLNDSLENLDCEDQLYKLVGTTNQEVTDFRNKFLETENKIKNREGTSEEIRKNYFYFNEISMSKLKCLPEFADRFKIISSLLSAMELPEKSNIYTVTSGDNLRKISKKLFGDVKYWKEIWNVNKDIITDPDLIYPGQQLNIP